MKFTDLAKSLEEGLAPVYLIEGEEAYFRTHAVKAICAACKISQPLLNDVREEGENLKGEKLAAFRDSLYSMPFFDEKRLVRVYDFYPTEREWETFLKGYVQAPCPSTVLCIVNAQKKPGCDMKKKSGVTFVDCARAGEETLQKWLFSLQRRAGLVPEADAVGLMVRYCALNAARLKTETEKLKCLLGEGGRVTRQVVEEHIERDVEYKIYELTQAASRKNFNAFSQILNDLLRKGYDENAVLSALASHFKTLAEIEGMRGSDASVAKTLGMNAYAVQKDRELLSLFPKGRAQRLYLEIYTLLCNMRSGLCTKSGALTAARAKIFFEQTKNER